MCRQSDLGLHACQQADVDGVTFLGIDQLDDVQAV